MENTSIRTLFQLIGSSFWVIVIAIALQSNVKAATIYARADGGWSNTNTWSTIGTGGTSCGCTPSATDSVVIDGRNISITSADITIATLTLTNAINAHSSLQIINGHTLIITGNVWAKAENFSKNVELIIAQNGSNIQVQGNVVFERVSTNGKAQFLRLNMSDNTVFNVAGNFTYNYLNSSVSEGNEEILLINEATVNIGGNVLWRMDDGNNFVISQSNTSQLNVTGTTTIDMNGGVDFQYTLENSAKFYSGGNMLVDIDGGKNFLVSMSNGAGTEHFKVNGNLTIDKTNARDVTFDLLSSAELKVMGDFSYTSTSASAGNSDFSILMANSSKATILGNTTITMNESTQTDCDIIIDLNNTAQFNVGTNDGLLAKSCSLTMMDGEILKLEMDRDAAMNVYGNMILTQNGTENLQILLNQNNDGSAADAQLNVNGNLTISKNDGLNMQIYLARDADIAVHKNMNITFGDANGANSAGIILENASAITVDSSSTITLNCTNQTNNDFTIALNNTSVFSVGPPTGPYTTRKFTVNLQQSRDFKIDLSNSATLTVYGTFNVVKAGGRNFTANPSSTSRITVFNDLDLDNTENADLLLFSMTGSGELNVKGNIDMLGALSSGKVELRLANTSALYIGKNFLRNSTPNAFGILNATGTSTVHYNGVVSQVIAKNTGSGTDVFTYQNLTINNSYANAPQLIVEGSTVINGTLTLANGKVQTTSANYLEVASGGSISGGSANSHIIGPLRKVGNSAFTFVVGNGTSFGKIGISAPSSSSTFEAEFQKQAYSDVTNMESTLTKISTLEYWTLNRVAGTGSCKVTLYWDDADAHGINNLTDLVVSKYNTSLNKWEDLGQSATSGGVGVGVSGSVTSSLSPSTFSPFTFGSRTTSNPLPVELLYFEAQQKNESIIELNWATASEINNAYFVVERSNNAVDFESIGTVEGAGNSNTVLTYKYNDVLPLQATSYYRLKQVDFNGEYEYSQILPLTRGTTSLAQYEWSVFPNPVSSKEALLIAAQQADEEVHIQLFDVVGKLVYESNESSKYEYVIHIASMGGLPSGVYNLIIQTPQKLFSNKVVITQ